MSRYAAASGNGVEITGCFYIQGPAPVGEPPPEVIALFDRYPDLHTVALIRDSDGRKNLGDVYQRMK